MLTSASVSSMLSESRDLADRIVLENIPSSHIYLNLICSAMRVNQCIKFDYSPYSRSSTTYGIILEPYFLKIFRQRWYITGMNVSDKKVKTYALDRCKEMEIVGRTFFLPDGFNVKDFVSGSFGIVFSSDPVEEVIVRVDPRHAKYLRTLPLHESQQEMGYDAPFCDFSYRLRITPDFIRELMSFGPALTVVSPPSLRDKMEEQFAEALENYRRLNTLDLSAGSEAGA